MQVPRLKRIRHALAAMSESELYGLRAASEQATGIASGLFAWLEHIAGWEIDRRERQNYLLRFPSESIEDADIPEALLALGALRLTFRTRGGSPEIEELLAAAVELVDARAHLH
jgi:hypothetical protein